MLIVERSKVETFMVGVSSTLRSIFTYSLYIYTFTRLSVIVVLVLFILTLLRFFRICPQNVDYLKGERVLRLALAATF